ncbi:MAG: endolytic transglycosylase MltG [Clostridia bacterium]|nr:endolytic transglycosylase MltG [Clostridia bacterium]
MRRKKKKFFKRLIIALLIIAMANTALRAIKKGTASITIPEGANSIEISEILKENGLINSKTYFLARLYFSQYRGKLQYGKFKIDKNAFLNTIFDTLSKDGAKKETISVTIPEGFSVEMIGDRLESLGLCTKAEFENAVKSDYDYDFLKAIPKSKDIKYRLQGFLYPETYEFYSDETATNIVDTLLKEFDKRVSPLNIPKDKIFEIITKASMVEREAKLDSERDIIAGVFENRLKKNMRLQIDATVAYAATNGRYNINRVMKRDLKVQSKYNTYMYSGLPVGPICSPSIKSISAAQNPKKHNYLYYHTDTAKNDGSHIFSESYAEHTSTIK